MINSSICVFCGSRSGVRPAYVEAARTLGHAIARNSWRLVYGAGDVGLMGEVARSAISAGATSLGVIPVHLLDREKGKRDLSTLIVTEDMHERKRLMFERSDAFVALPGGIGTLEELVEQLTWAQLGRHSKPIVLVNIDRFWDPLIGLLDHMRAEAFIREGLEVRYVVVDRPEEVVPVVIKTAVLAEPTKPDPALPEKF